MSVERGSMLYQTGRHEMAEQEFRAALVEEPNNALAHAMIAMCLLKRKEYTEATEEARQAIVLRPQWHIGYSVMASVMLERERLKEAVTAIEQALQFDPFNPTHHAVLAEIRLRQRKWAEALAAADRGLEVDPEHAGCVNARGIALVNLGRRGEAGATIEGALSRDPLNAVTHANQGWSLLHAGDHKAALLHFREALRLNPELQWAKAGIVEALKARNIVYRLMLRYFLFMSRLGRRTQWGIVLGGYFGYQAVRALSQQSPALAPFALPLMIAYIAFVWMSWLASPLFNLMLRLDRFGRYALSDTQRAASNWFAACLVAAVACAAIGFLEHDDRYLLGAIVAATLSIPVTAVFTCGEGWPRRGMAGYAAAMALLGIGLTVWVFVAPALPKVEAGWRDNLTTLYVVGLILSGFVANALSMARARR